MTRVIRVEALVHDQLKASMARGDTYNDAVKRLLSARPEGQVVVLNLDGLTMALQDLTAILRQTRPPGI